jgi:hypothetical protein
MDPINENETKVVDDISTRYIQARKTFHDMEAPAVKALVKHGPALISGEEQPPEDEEKDRIQEIEAYRKQRALDAIARGQDPEEIEYEWGEGGQGATHPGMYDPIDLAVDFMTGGITGLRKVGGKALTKAGAKILGKSVAEDVGYGMAAGGFMTGAEKAGAGPLVQTLSGLIGATATSGLLTMGRKGFATWLRRVRETNPRVYEKVVKAAESDADNALAKAIIEEHTGKAPKEPEIAPELTTKVDKTLGYDQAPLVNLAKKKSTKAAQFLETEEIPLPEKAININFARISSGDDVKEVIAKTAKVFEPEIQTARRGVQSHAETEKLANLIGLTPERLLQRRKGQAFNAEEALAARRVLVSSAEKLNELAAKVASPEATDLDKFAFRKQLSTHYAIQSQVSGMTAEAGRALNAFKIEAKSTKAKLQQMDELLKTLPGRVSTEELAEALTTIKTAEGVNVFVRQAQKATTYDMFVEAWINGLLSGPQTHAVNTLSNTLTALWMVPERLLAAGIGRLSGNQAIKEQEALYQAYGLIEGFRDGLKAFAHAVRTGEGPDVIEKIESGGYRSITAENLRQTFIGRKLGRSLEEGGTASRAVDLLGETLRLPGRFLTAEDSLFKTVGYRMELRARAFRQAMEEGLSGDAAAKRIQEILADPETMAPDIHLAAIDAARYQTFTRPLGEAGRSFQRTIHKIPALRLIVPFVRTPTNILKFAMERTPLAVASKNIRADIAAGGARRDLALARISMGSMIMATASTLAAEGYITGGGPTDPKMKSIKYNTGWQPYSVKIGDKYYAYNRLEPVGMALGLAADMAEIMGQVGDVEAEELAAAAVMAIAKNTTSKTWLRGMSEALKAWDQPDRYGNRYLQRFAASTVPAAVAQVERVVDPQMRAVYSLMDAIKDRVPGYSDDLPPRRNIWGDPIVLGGGLGPDIASPIYTSEVKDSPIDNELLRLETPISMPQKTMSFEGVPVELQPKEYDRFLVLMNSIPLHTGKTLKKSLDHLVTRDPDYRRLTDEQKELRIREIVAEAKERAKEQLVEENGVIRYLIDEQHRSLQRR